MRSTKYDSFSVMVDESRLFTIDYFLLPMLQAQAKYALSSDTTKVFGSRLSSQDLKDFLGKYGIANDEGVSGVGIQSLGPGVGRASVSSFREVGKKYETTFPFMMEGFPIRYMLGTSYYCNCDAGRNKRRETDLQMCAHTSLATIHSSYEHGSDVGLKDEGVVKLSAGLISDLTGEKKMGNSDVYESFEWRKKEFKKRFKESFSRVLESRSRRSSPQASSKWPS